MREIGTHEAKTNLSELLVQVEGGEQFLITRRGVPVAKLTPVSETIHSLENLCKKMLLDRDSKGRANLAEAKLWKHEGHKR